MSRNPGAYCGQRLRAARQGTLIASGADGVPGLAQALLGAAFLGSGLLLHHERQHHGRCHTSVSSEARTYRRQPVVIQCASTPRPRKLSHSISTILAMSRMVISSSRCSTHYDDCCFLPIHVTATGPPVAVILRPGKTPSGKEVRGHLRRIIRRIRTHWPTTKITIRGDSHYGRREVRDWCEDNGLHYVFGLSGNKLLAAAVEVQADDIRTRRALEQAPVLRSYTQTNYAAKSWKGERRV